MSAPVLTRRRREFVLEAVRARSSARVTDLAKELEVSEMTIRRDLSTLAGEGKLVRVRGGAVLEAPYRPFAEVEGENYAERDRIGEAAAKLVSEGETLLIDIGTTPLQLARHLRGRRLTVITNNLAVYEELVSEPLVDLILLGGQLNREYRALGGFLVEEGLRQLSADQGFLGAAGIRRDLTIVDDAMGEMPIKRAMIAASGAVTLLVDSSKFGVAGGARICAPEQIDVIVTDTGAPRSMVQELEARGVRVIVA